MWTFVVATAFVSLITWSCVIKDIKETNNKAPNGKKFIKKFDEIVDDIHTAQIKSKVQEMWATKNNKTFKVRVEHKPSDSMDFTTRYKLNNIYINDELVCKEHILKVYSKDIVTFEFSHKRDIDEIVDIVTIAHKQAKEIIDEYYKEMLNISKETKSFYSYSNSEDK